MIKESNGNIIFANVAQVTDEQFERKESSTSLQHNFTKIEAEDTKYNLIILSILESLIHYIPEDVWP